MKLLIVVMNYYPSVGGTQVFFQHLAEYCVRQFGFEVQVYTTDSYYGPEKDRYKKIEVAEECINGVQVKRFSYRRWHRKPFLMAQKVCIKLFNRSSSFLSTRRTGPWSPSLQKALENTDADVIVGATSSYKYMAYPLLRSKFQNRKPFIYQGALHFDAQKKEQYLVPKVLSAIKQSEYYLANSVYEKNVLKSMGVPAENVEVLGIAVEPDINTSTFDVSYRPQLHLDASQPLIGFVGRITELKSIPVLVNAMQIVCGQMPEAHLIIAGEDNGYAENLKHLVSQLPPAISNNIHFRLSIDEQEKNSIYSSIDVLVLPSKSESFGLVFLEAWRFKKAVIGARIGAINSIINDAVDGMLFEPDDTKHLATCILKLLQDEEQRKRLGEAGYQKLMNNYTWDILGKKFKRICEEAVHKFHSTKSGVA